MGYKHQSDTAFKDENGFWNGFEVFESWNWLMPVVEKIDDLFGDMDEVDDMINKVHNSVLQFDISVLHKSVIEFIKWYNQNK